MLLRKSLLICFCLFSILASGQEQIYFNERIDHYHNYDNARNVINLEDGYMVFGATFDTIYNYFVQNTFSKLTPEGDVDWVKTYGDTINDYLDGQPGSIIKYSNNRYFTCGYRTIWEGEELSYCGYLMCLDADFDTLWTRSYCEDTLPYDTTYVLHQVKKCDDGGLVFAGVFLTETEYAKIWLLKTDSLGNKEWERFFGDGTQLYQGYSVLQTTDGGYAIGGYKYKIHDYTTGDPLIIKTDSLGNEEWTYNPGSNLIDNKVMLVLSKDGQIIAATNYATEPYGDSRDAKNQILKINNDGSIVFNKTYGTSKYNNYLLQVREKDNGDIISTGTYRSFDESTPSSLGWILCVDSNGDQKWYREYVNLSGRHSFNHLRDIIITEDKGFLACGQVEPAPPDTGNEDIWVLKLDSLGYDTTTVGINQQLSYNGISLYINPNPVNNAFDLSINKPSKNNVFVSIYNLYGLKVQDIEIPSGEQSVKVNASNWQSGLYVAVLKQYGKVVVKRKFVVK